MRLSVILFAVLLLLASGVAAQEVKFIDATHDLDRPSPWSHMPPSNFSNKNIRGPDPVLEKRIESVEQHGVLRTTVTSLDHYEHDLSSFDDLSIEFEVRVENAGTDPIRLPIRMELTSLQAAANQRSFGYWQMGIALFPKTVPKSSGPPVQWRDPHHPFADVQFYGSDAEPDTMITLKPHEWLTVRSNDWIDLTYPKDRGEYLKYLSTIVGVTASCGLGSGWFDTERGNLLFGNRVTEVEGPPFPVHLTDSKP